MARVHRFFVGPDLDLKHNLWIHDERLISQWSKVLRYKAGQEMVLFDGTAHDKLYKLDSLSSKEAHLIYITDFERKLPPKNIYLLWSLLKKDKNDWVLQKCTELGVSHFVPILAERSEKTGFNIERAKKIAIEASEQCGRSDIPTLREPMTIEAAINNFKGSVPLLICEETAGKETWTDFENIGVVIGPEGGWSQQEKEIFEKYHIPKLALHDFTLRAETACVAAVTKLLQ